MMMVIAAALAAAQPAPAATTTVPGHAHAQPQQIGQMGTMSEEMADCRKCCEDMMAKMHEDHAKHSDHKPQ
jgi:hypothetical protein